MEIPSSTRATVYPLNPALVMRNKMHQNNGGTVSGAKRHVTGNIQFRRVIYNAG